MHMYTASPYRSSSSSSLAVSTQEGMNAVAFEEKHGDLVRREFSEYTTAYTLQKALEKRRPPIRVSVAMLRVWFGKITLPEGAVKVSSSTELQALYGEELDSLAEENPSAYKLRQALKKRSPPVYITDGIAKEWFKRYRGELQYINSAGHLELTCGARIREAESTADMQPTDLRVWLRKNLSVEAAVSTCQTWRQKDWSSAGKLLSILDVERDIGERLRLPRYKDSFTEEATPVLATSLAEGQPPVFVKAQLLRQWFVKYHPDSGPHSIANADALEELMGDEMREQYADITGYKALAAVLSR